jgi:hypothetical protein
MQLSMKATCIHSKEVAEMFARRKKVDSGLISTKTGNRLLRMLRSEEGFQAPLAGLERRDEEDVCCGFEQEVRKAMLDFECKKSNAIMAMQRSQNLR